MTRKEMYEKAARFLSRHKHIKGAYFSVDGKLTQHLHRDLEPEPDGCCVLGALRWVSRDGELLDMHTSFGELMSCIGAEDGIEIVDWNDAPTRTKKDAVHALNCAAELCE